MSLAFRCAIVAPLGDALVVGNPGPVGGIDISMPSPAESERSRNENRHPQVVRVAGMVRGGYVRGNGDPGVGGEQEGSP